MDREAECNFGVGGTSSLQGEEPDISTAGTTVLRRFRANVLSFILRWGVRTGHMHTEERDAWPTSNEVQTEQMSRSRMSCVIKSLFCFREKGGRKQNKKSSLATETMNRVTEPPQEVVYKLIHEFNNSRTASYIQIIQMTYFTNTDYLSPKI
jgi:hypothetical protein